MTRASVFTVLGILLLATPQCFGAEPGTVDSQSFRAYDRPSDDGSAILVVWARPDNEPKGVQYAVEVAPREEDFGTDRARTKFVAALPASLASNNHKYLGASVGNEKLFYATITPAELFPPAEPGDITPERLHAFSSKKIIDDAELKRALSALAALDTPDNALVGAQKTDRKWFTYLQAYLKEKDQDADEASKADINHTTYFFRLAVLNGDQKSYVERDGRPVVVSAAAHADLFAGFKLNNLIFSLVFSAIVIAFIQAARRQPNLFIRKIAGLDAVDEAIGRSTEMNRPVFFVHGGASAMDDMATIASVNILARVARRTAEHDTRIRVMNNDPIVMAVSQEVVQQAYTAAGRPDAYNPDDVSLVASEQFSYVAAVSGSMVREQPGAIFLLGSFFAESLLLAETGASTGAIQVAGTDQYTQLPFFITTCDYTLIGEELYAASAYLSREPRQLGSLRGQDVGKAFLMVTVVVVVVVMTAVVASHEGDSWLRYIRYIFEAL